MYKHLFLAANTRKYTCKKLCHLLELAAEQYKATVLISLSLRVPCGDRRFVFSLCLSSRLITVIDLPTCLAVHSGLFACVDVVFQITGRCNLCYSTPAALSSRAVPRGIAATAAAGIVYMPASC